MDFGCDADGPDQVHKRSLARRELRKLAAQGPWD